VARVKDEEIIEEREELLAGGENLIDFVWSFVGGGDGEGLEGAVGWGEG
jgi:hypothetical protein